MEALQSKVKAFARLAARVKASRLPSAQPVFKPVCDTGERCPASLTHVAASPNWSINSWFVCAAVRSQYFRNKLHSGMAVSEEEIRKGEKSLFFLGIIPISAQGRCHLKQD